jgi:hypothetical protein
MKKDKLFVIKKYVMAPNAKAALRKERKTEVDDIWIDDDWRKNSKDNLAAAIGFQIDIEE